MGEFLCHIILKNLEILYKWATIKKLRGLIGAGYYIT